MKKKLSNIVIILIFVAGLSLLVYPFVANKWNSYRQDCLISNYEKIVSQKSDSIDYDAEMKKAKAYNDALAPHILPDSFIKAENQKSEDKSYTSALNLAGDGIMGIVEIPKIGVKLPIYHTTCEEVLSKAAGHLEGSSLPVGGKDTHAVISAHRGLPSATLFTDLDQVKKGDHFLVHILNKTLCYEVDSIVETEPDDTSSLAVQEGKDLVSLLTCTPYGVNTQRLIVTGHRVSYNKSVVNKEKKNDFTSLHTNYLLWVIVGLAVTGGFIFILYKKDKKMRSKE
jgi:sortase A